MIEQINQQMRFEQAASIPPQTHVVDTFPKLTEIDLLWHCSTAYAFGLCLSSPDIRHHSALPICLFPRSPEFGIAARPGKRGRYLGIRRVRHA